MANSDRQLILILADLGYRFFFRAFPSEFRVLVRDEVRGAFVDGCRRALKRGGPFELMGYASRGYWDAVKEGYAERRGIRRNNRVWSRPTPGFSLDLFLSDLRFASRRLRRRPVFTGVAVLTLALGIGAATAIFSVVNGVLLRPFPYPDAEQLVVLWNTNPERGQEEFRMSAPDLFELQRSVSSFSGLALAAGATANLTGEDLPPVRVEGALISAGFFEILGVHPLMGRLFQDEENHGDSRVVLLSHSLWVGRFGGDPEMVGKTIIMDGMALQVAGVMPPVPLPIGGSALELPGPDVPLFWRPMDYTVDWVSDIGAHVMAGLARLDSGVTRAQAQEEVSAVASALVAENGAPPGQEILLRSFKEQIVGDVSRSLVILLGAVGLLLLMACGNVANLLLARAKDRGRELSIRSAVGAGRTRLVKETLTETTLLSLMGGSLGLALARWGSVSMVDLLPSNLPRQNEIGVEGKVLLFALAAVFLASALAALVPTLRLAGRDAVVGLKAGGRGGMAARERNRANRTIVVAQLCLATVLLFCGGLLFRSLRTLEGVDAGFRKGGVLTAQLMLPDIRYGGPGEVVSFFDEVQRRVGGLPGVSSVAFGMNHPLENTWWNGIGLLDRPNPDPGESPTAIFRPVSDGYFDTMGIPMIEGRPFDRGDGWDGHPVMVVNRAFVDHYYQGESPLGDRIEFVVGRFIWGEEAPTVFEVVGVVGDVRFNGLREPSEPAFHIPMHQFPYQAVRLMVRTSEEPESLTGMLQETIWALDPDLPVTDVRTMDQIFSAAVAQDRFNVILLEVFALAALILAAAGTYGVLSYAVSQRRAEIGVRMALGATSSSVLVMVVRDAAILGGMGLTLGLGMALALSRSLGSLLFQVPTHDLLVVGVVSSVLGIVALGSGLVPAVRAANTDPMESLRAE